MILLTKENVIAALKLRLRHLEVMRRRSISTALRQHAAVEIKAIRRSISS